MIAPLVVRIGTDHSFQITWGLFYVPVDPTPPSFVVVRQPASQAFLAFAFSGPVPSARRGIAFARARRPEIQSVCNGP